MGAIEITKIIEWDMGHRIPNHDSLCRFPHGHRYRLEATVTGKICDRQGDSSEGMVVDFGLLKQILKVQVHDRLDHKFVYHVEDRVVADWASAHFPAGSCAVDFIPTAENLVNWCRILVEPHLTPLGLQIVRLRLFETPNSWADYVAAPAWGG
ncbi:MAG: 6-carboxytetrahydropterin synthase [Zetaproteobacteria bacterium]|nr:6-carboxytetrahydropterin synthase [Zetaproteobacteria bacterium]